jgi:hypothetical protein
LKTNKIIALLNWWTYLVIYTVYRFASIALIAVSIMSIMEWWPWSIITIAVLLFVQIFPHLLVIFQIHKTNRVLLAMANRIKKRHIINLGPYYGVVFLSKARQIQSLVNETLVTRNGKNLYSWIKDRRNYSYPP